MTTYDGRCQGYIPGKLAPNKEPSISKHIVEKSYRVHRKRIIEAKPIVDTHISIPDFLIDRSWKQLVNKEKERMLQRENEEIYRRLHKIETKGRFGSNKSLSSDPPLDESIESNSPFEESNSSQAKSKKLMIEMNETERHLLRAQEQARYFKKLKDKERYDNKIRIQKDNEHILKRIQNTKSLYGLNTMKEWYKKHERFKNTRSFDPTAGHIMTNMKGLLPPPLKSSEPIDMSSISSASTKLRNTKKFLSSSTSSISSSSSYQDQYPLLSLTEYYTFNSQPNGAKKLPSISSNSSISTASSLPTLSSKYTYGNFQPPHRGSNSSIASVSTFSKENDFDNESIFSIQTNNSLTYSTQSEAPEKKKSFINAFQNTSSSGTSVDNTNSNSSRKKMPSFSSIVTNESSTDYIKSEIGPSRTNSNDHIQFDCENELNNEEDELSQLPINNSSENDLSTYNCFTPTTYATFLEDHEFLCTIPLTVHNHQTTSFYVNAYTKKLNFNEIIREFYNKNGKNTTPNNSLLDNQDHSILDHDDDLIIFTVTHPSSIYQNISNFNVKNIDTDQHNYDENNQETKNGTENSSNINSSNLMISISNTSNSSNNDTLPIIVRCLKVTEALKIIHNMGTNKKIIHSIESEDLQSLSSLLINMFNSYSKDSLSTGLRYEDFQKLMDNIELGISDQELRYVINDIDENNNGIIEFNEFVPLAVDLILSFRARNKAKIMVSQENIVLNQLMNKCLESKDLHNISNIALNLLQKYDIKKVGTVRINEFKKVLNEIAEMNIGLDEVEVHLMIAYMPQNQYKRIQINHPTLTFFNVLVRVRLINWKYMLMMKRDTTSGLQRYLWNLCYEEEKRLYYNSKSYNVNATTQINSSSNDNTSIVTDDFIPRCELPIHNIICLLSNSSRLSLSRLQVFVLMSDTAGLTTSNQDILTDCGLNLYGINEEDSLYNNSRLNHIKSNDISNSPTPDSPQIANNFFLNSSDNTGMINYLIFIPLAARAIEHMFDPKTLRQRAELIEKTDLSSRALLNNMLEAQKEKKSRELKKKRSSIMIPTTTNSSINSIRKSRSLSISQHLMQIDINMDEGTPLVSVLTRQNTSNSLSDESNNQFPESPQKSIEPKTSHEKFISRLYTLFRSYDIDHNHLLDPTEFQSCLCSLDLQLSHTEIVALATVADRNQTGYLQFDDFSHFFYTHLLGLEKEKRIRTLLLDLESSELIDKETVHILENKDKFSDEIQSEYKNNNFTKLVSVANDLVVERSIFLQQFIEVIELFDTSQEKVISYENLLWILKRFDLSSSKFIKEYLYSQLYIEKTEDSNDNPKVHYYKSIKFWDQFIRVLRAKQYLIREIQNEMTLASIKAQNRYKALPLSTTYNHNNELIPLPVTKLISKFKDLNEAFNLNLYNIVPDRFNDILKFLTSQHSYLSKVELNYFLALIFYKIIPNILLIPRLNCTSSNMKYNSKFSTNMNSNASDLNSDSSNDFNDVRYNKRLSKQITPIQLPNTGSSSLSSNESSTPSNSIPLTNFHQHYSSLVSLPFSPTSVEIMVDNIIKYFSSPTNSNSVSNPNHFRNLKVHISSKQIEEAYFQAKKFAVRYNQLMDTSSSSSSLINQVYNILTQFSNSNKKQDTHLELPYISLRDVYSALIYNRVSTYTDSELLNMLSFFESSIITSLCNSGNYDAEILFEQGIGLDIYEVSEALGLMMRHLSLISSIECESRVSSFNTIHQRDVKNILEEAYEQVYKDYIQDINNQTSNIPIIQTHNESLLNDNQDNHDDFIDQKDELLDIVPKDITLTPKSNMLMRKQGSFNHHLLLLHQTLTPTSKTKHINRFEVDSPENIIESLAQQEINSNETIISKPTTPSNNLGMGNNKSNIVDIISKGKISKNQLQEVLIRCKEKLKLSQHSIDSIIVTIFSSNMNIVNWNDIIFTLVDLARMHSSQHPNKTRLSTIIFNKKIDESSFVSSPPHSSPIATSKSSFSIPSLNKNECVNHIPLTRSSSKSSILSNPIIHLDPTSSLVSINLTSDNSLETTQDEGNFEDNSYNINKLFDSKFKSLRHISEKIVNFSKLFIIPNNFDLSGNSENNYNISNNLSKFKFNKLFLSFPNDLLYKEYLHQSSLSTANNENIASKSDTKHVKSSILLRKLAYIPFVTVEFLSEQMASKNSKFNSNFRQNSFNFNKLVYSNTSFNSDDSSSSSISDGSTVFYEYVNHISSFERLKNYKVTVAELDAATLRARANSRNYEDNLSNESQTCSTPSTQQISQYFISLKSARPQSSSVNKPKQYSIIKRYTCTFVPIVISVQSIDDHILNVTKSITISLTNSDCSINLKKEFPYKLSSLSVIDNNIANQYIKNIINNIYIEKLNNHFILSEEHESINDYNVSIVINE